MADYKGKINGTLSKIPKSKGNFEDKKPRGNSSGEFFSRGISEMMNDKAVIVGLAALVLVFIVVIVLIATVPVPGIRDLLNSVPANTTTQQHVDSEGTSQDSQNATTNQTSSYKLKPGDEKKIEYLAMVFAQSENLSLNVISEGVDIISNLNDASRSSILYMTVNRPPEWADSPLSIKSGRVTASDADVKKRMTDLFGADAPALSTEGFQYTIEKKGDVWEFSLAAGGVYYESKLESVSVSGNEITAECLVVGYDNWSITRSSRWMLVLVPEKDNFFDYRVTSMGKISAESETNIKNASINIPVSKFNHPSYTFDEQPYMVWHAIPDSNTEVSPTLHFGTSKSILGVAISFGNYYEHEGTGCNYEFEGHFAPIADVVVL